VTCGAEACNPTPQAIESGRTFVSVDAGFFHTCGVTPGNQGFCWGGNGFGELGTGIVEPGVNSAAGDPTPQPIFGGLAFRSVSAGAVYTCGVTTGDVAYCWGASTSGQLGNGRSDGPVLLGPPLPLFVQPAPVPVAGNFRFARIETHQGNNALGHTCGVITNRQLFCWGDNRLSELGAPSSDTCIFRALSFSCSTAPVPVSGGFRFLDLAVMSPGGHVCGVGVAVHILCWGDNTFGQLGDATTVKRATPTEIVPPELAPGRAGGVAAFEKRPEGWSALLPLPFN
jgi:alpha-tubulin suppressor-like RCC1 family protein